MSAINAAQLAARMRAAAIEGLTLSAERVRAVTVPRAPLEEGDMRSSLTVVPADDDLQAAVVSDSPYAVIQHERLDFYHDDGEAKYLERGTLASVSDVQRIMQTAVNKHLKG